MKKALQPKVLVVGGGPGGYVAAIRCGQLGLDTVLVENDRVGGTCLIRGCIPSKAIIHAAGEFESMVAAASAPRYGIALDSAPRIDFGATTRWKETIVNRLNGGVSSLLARAKVRTVQGWAKFSDAKNCRVATADGDVAITAEHVILATGSTPVELPFMPFGGKVISSTDALSLQQLPQRLVVVGAGYIGLELGIAMRKLGVDVTIVEAQSQILPLYDAKLIEPVRLWLERHGVKLHLDARVRGLDQAGDGVEVEIRDRGIVSLPADKVLVTVGRKPVVDGWGLEEMSVAMDGRFVRVDDRCATSTKHVWAIGDLVGEPMLAHKASAQGEMVAEIIAGKRRRFDAKAIPAICFTEPEIVAVGLSPGAPGVPADALVAIFPLQANGRALSMSAGDDGGFVRIVARKDDHVILGVQAVGRHISELAGEFTHAIEMGAVLEDVAGTIHAHPSLGEAFHESALKALGHAIHI
jgi:dihydrolipoamide dehydrogenase